jgi:predicted metal-dependent phosphoesterase TrpH
MEKMFANLHLHSTHSDGAYTPQKLVEIGISEGYRALALTDHDTVSGNKEFMEICAQNGLESLFGVEFTCEGLGTDFHIVAFDFDADNEQMHEHLVNLSRAATKRTYDLFNKAQSEGRLLGITWDEVLEFNKGITWLCNEHVFRLLLSKNLIKPEGYWQFMKENFSYNIPYVSEFKKPTIKETIDLIINAGGIPILAHPGLGDKRPYLDELLDMGIKGFEVHHHANSIDAIDFLLEYAKKRGLYISGGTDHHGMMGGEYEKGEEGKKRFWLEPCSMGTTEEYFRQIKNRVYG